MASRSIWSATLAGAIIGTLAAAIVLLMPVIGIRKDIDHLILHWQEMALYVSCIAVSAVAGARYKYRTARQYQQFLEGGADTEEVLALNIVPNTVSRVVPLPSHALTEKKDEQPGSLSAELPSSTNLAHGGETSLAGLEPDESFSERKSALTTDISVRDQQTEETPFSVGTNENSDTSDEVLTVPPIEESLAGGPKKRRFRLGADESKRRTLLLAILLYLILFVKCALLCQRLKLGVIILDPVSEELLRSFGLGITVAGLYLAARGLFVSVEAETPAGNTIPNTVPNPRSHVPPTRLSFLRQHPICTGWLVILTGLPLVYQAWFPLLAIPGIFVAMNWMFPRRRIAPW